MPRLKRPLATSLVVAAAAAAAALWLYVAHGRAAHRARPEPVPIQDGKTIDFSSGSPVIKDDKENKAAMDAALKAIEEATRTVSFSGEPTPTK